MKNLQIFGLLMVLVFSATVFGQEKEKEKPKETEKVKEVEKTKEMPKENSLNWFLSNNTNRFRPNYNYPLVWISGPRNRNPNPPIPNQIPDVTDVELIFENLIDDELNYNLCSPKNSSMIEIITKAVDLDGDTLVYNYTVSGGRIIGVGAKVSWDLSGVKPGAYTITAAVDDGCGFCGKVVTKTVVVKE